MILKILELSIIFFIITMVVIFIKAYFDIKKNRYYSLSQYNEYHGHVNTKRIHRGIPPLIKNNIIAARISDDFCHGIGKYKLLMATVGKEGYIRYVDEAGEEIPITAIDKWCDVSQIKQQHDDSQ